MAFLLMMLMVFHAIGALVFIPAMVSLLRPRFATAKADQQPARIAVEAWSEAVDASRSQLAVRSWDCGRALNVTAQQPQQPQHGVPSLRRPRRPSAPRCAPGCAPTCRPAGARAAYREPRTAEEKIAASKAWQATLYRGGWAGITWPREYGGRGATLVEQLIFNEECAAANAPDSINLAVALGLVGPTLMACGTPEQQARFLPRILRGDDIWCQGFSEPNAGSDLAGAEDARRGARATTSSSPGRRSGPASRSTPTGASWSCAPTRARRASTTG